ncbi:hypothetical protein MIMGU_mgv1a020612mg [Erythranthe guttata]|uniref:Large ribosomal subunit protein uL24 C-terminal domain-containing protein n=1 Tax=Erythranthe guttata TaxID=4155 RepID=A0A022R448_ERYGU|nr:hypothetical protein MIMGU_mgv1a020612mg [Erythranthe guttata]
MFLDLVVKSKEQPILIVSKIHNLELKIFFQVEAPIHSSNVMLYSKEKDVVTRVGHKTLENGKRVRYLIKTGEVIDSAENWKKAVKEKSKELALNT